jgi:hypothetical protein
VSSLAGAFTVLGLLFAAIFEASQVLLQKRLHFSEAGMRIPGRLLAGFFYIHALVVVFCFYPAESLGRSMVRLLARRCF